MKSRQILVAPRSRPPFRLFAFFSANPTSEIKMNGDGTVVAQTAQSAVSRVANPQALRYLTRSGIPSHADWQSAKRQTRQSALRRRRSGSRSQCVVRFLHAHASDDADVAVVMKQ